MFCRGAILLIASLLTIHAHPLIAQRPPAVAAIDVNVDGRPPSYDRKSDGPRFYLWRDAAGWHLHSRSARKAHSFSGTIRVIGSKFHDLRGIGGLEKKEDFGSINSAGNVINFKFRTANRGDGIDFKVGNAATRVEFDLQIDGYPRAKQIDIGANAESPVDAGFAIPLQPEKK